MANTSVNYIMNFKAQDNEILKYLDDLNKRVENNKLVIPFSADMSEITSALKKVAKLRPEIDSTVSLELDTKGYTKQFEAIESYSKKSSKEIIKNLKNSIQDGDFGTASFKGDKSLYKKFILEQTGGQNVSRDKAQEALTKLRQIAENVNIQSNSTFEDIIRQAQALEKLSTVSKGLSSSKNYSDLVSEQDLKNIQKQLTSFYAEAGQHISKNLPTLQTGVKQSFDTYIADLRNAFGDVVRIIDEAQAATKEANKSAEELIENYQQLQTKIGGIKNKQKASQKITQEDLLDLKNSIEGDVVSYNQTQDKGMRKNMSSNLQKDIKTYMQNVQDFVRAGGQLDENLASFYNKYKDKKWALDMYVPIDEIKSFDQEIDSLTQSMISLQKTMDIKGIDWTQISKKGNINSNDIANSQKTEISKDKMQLRDEIAGIYDDLEDDERFWSDDNYAEKKKQEILSLIDSYKQLGGTIHEIKQTFETPMEAATFEEDIIDWQKQFNTSELKSVKEKVVTDVDEVKQSVKAVNNDIKQQSLSNKEAAVNDTIATTINPKEFVGKINAQLSQSGEKVNIDVAPAVEAGAFVLDIEEKLKGHALNVNIKSDISGETQDVLSSNTKIIHDEEQNFTSLKQTINAVEQAIDRKTRAFQEEGQVVEGVVQNEIGNLERLQGELITLQNHISELSAELKTLPNIHFNIDTSKIGKIDINIDETSVGNLDRFRNSITLLEAEVNDGNLQSRLNDIFIALDRFKQLKDIQGINLKELNLSGLTRFATEENCNKIKLLSDNISRLIASLKEFQGVAFNKELLSELKVSKASAENMFNMAVALESVGNALKSFDKDAEKVLNSIKEITEKTNGLKNLHAILKSGKNINEVVEASSNNVSDNTKKISEAAKEAGKEYDKLTKSLRNFYYLKSKLASGEKITASQKSTVERTERDIENAKKGKGKYAGDIKKRKTFISENDNIMQQVADQRILDLQNELNAITVKIPLEFTTEEIQAKITKIQGLIDRLKTSKAVTLDFSDAVGELSKFKEATKDVVKQASSVGRAKLSKDIQTWLKNNTSASKEFTDRLEYMLTLLKNDMPAEELRKLKEEFFSLTAAATQAGKTGKSFTDQWKSRIKNLFVYLSSFTSFYEIIHLIRRGVDIIKEYDTALTEMRKVTNENITTLKEFQKTSFDLADSVGTTGKQLQQSTADWLRLGEVLEDAKQSAQDTSVLFNISEFENIESATESLVSMSQAYKDLAKMDIIDVMNKIGNNYSISTSELSESLQRSAATLTTAGNDLYEATALTTAGNAILQDPESVGAGLKIISLRLRGTKEASDELATLGEDTEGVIQTVSKLRDTIKEATAVNSNGLKGFDILDENKNYKSTYEIMLGLSEIYDEIVETDKKAGTNRASLLLETIAGKNRSNVAASILQNHDLLESVYQDAQTAEGSAQEELDKYLDSVDGKLQKIINQAHEFWLTFLDSEALKGIIDIGTVLLKTFGWILEFPEKIAPFSDGVFTSLSAIIGIVAGQQFGGGLIRLN